MSAEESKLVVRDSRAMAPQPAGQVSTLPAPVSQGDALMQMISRAAQSPDYDVAKLTALLAVKKEFEADEARKAFVNAMAEFKANPPHIVKNKHVAYIGTSYSHASHDEVTNKIVAGLAAVGISHRWDTKQNGHEITVTCTLTHRAGYSESNELTSRADDSGKKNPIQAIASAITYLQRYTLLSATGLSTAEMGAADDDGRAAGAPAEVAKPDPAPEGFSNWWADYIAVADEGLPKLEATWSSSSKAFRLYANKWYGSELARLKDVARGVQS